MKTITPTLAICLAAGLATGIALARPGSTVVASAPATTAPAASTSSTASASGAAPVPSEPIEIVDFAYNDTVVAPGSVVEVRNIDGVAHTVTAAGLFDTGIIDGSSAATFVAPDAPGTYDFICTIHPSMEGTLIVDG